MAYDVADFISSHFDEIFLSLKIPEDFPGLLGVSGIARNWNPITDVSKDLQPLTLILNDNMTAKSKCIIFMQYYGEKLFDSENQKKAKTAHKLFSKLLGFDEVNTYVDLSKHQIFEKIAVLQALAEQF